MTLAGGVSITVPRTRGYLYQEGAMVSPDGHCRAFDASAAGTVFGEGVGIVVLKRLAAARADGDTIYAVIRGVGVTNDGAAKVSFTAPSVDGQAAGGWDVNTSALIRVGYAAAVRLANVRIVESHAVKLPFAILQTLT